MFEDRVQFPPGFLESFCKRNHIRKLSLFGSVLRDDFNPSSDIDVLVEFDAGHSIGYFRLFDLQDELTKVLGRTVDLRTVGEISSHSIRRIQHESNLAYAA